MITKDTVMTLLLQACPSFEPYWKTYLEENYDTGDEQLLYIDLGEFARHIFILFKKENTSEIPAVFRVIELLHTDGDCFVKEAATIGLLESIQNIFLNNRIDPEIIAEYLGTESKIWWKKLNDFWSSND